MQSGYPFDVATCMYYTGLDPITMKEVPVVRNLHDHKLQRALMQFFKPQNWFEVRAALLQAGRADLIGDGCDALIPSKPPKAALETRRKQANRALDADHYHTVPKVKRGYRPGRKTQTRQTKPGREGPSPPARP